MNTIYIHDASDGRLLITAIPNNENDYSEAVERIAETNGMHFGDCNWGSIGEIIVTRKAIAMVKEAINPNI